MENNPKIKKLTITQVVSQKTRQRILMILANSVDYLKTSEIKELLQNKYNEKTKMNTLAFHMNLLYEFKLLRREEEVIKFVNISHRLNMKKFRAIYFWRIAHEGRALLKSRYGMELR